jgi:flavin reductase (DIM6/NTAB) family NADH-FMN oxidoreductase RutF
MTTLSEPSRKATLDDFRRLMAGFPTGVAIVTAMDPCGRPTGMTCSSLCSVTLDPPTLLVCLRRGSPTLESTLRGSGFTVNLMHAEAQATAELFASGAADRFTRVRWQANPGLGGPRLLDDAHAIADCRVSQLTRVGDHAVVFGEVCHVLLPSDYAAQPLLYGLRRYASWPGEARSSRPAR